MLRVLSAAHLRPSRGNRMGMPVSTWVEVDLDRFSANLRAVRALVGLDAPRHGRPGTRPPGGGLRRAGSCWW